MIDAMPAILQAPPRRGVRRSRRDAPQSRPRSGRGLSREPDGARARTRHRGPRRIPRSVRRPADAARLHFDVRRLRHALSQRGADDVGHAGLQLRARQGGRLDALLARARTAGRRARRSGAVRRCHRHRQRDRRAADRRRAAAGHARARLCEQPLDDMGADRRALPCRVRKPRAAAHRPRAIARPARRASRGNRAAAGDAHRPFPVACATTPGCSSMRSIRCRIAPRLLRRRQRPRAAAGLRAEQPGRTALARSVDGAAGRPSSSTRGIPIRGGSAIS